MTVCPSCGKENWGEDEHCNYCSAELMPAVDFADQRSKFGPHLKVGKKFKVGPDLVALAKEDGTVHVRQYPKAAWRPAILAGVLGAVGGALIPESIDPVRLWRIAVVIAALAIAYYANGDHHVRHWIVRSESLQVKKSVIGKPRVVLHKSGFLALRKAAPEGWRDKDRIELIIVRDGKSHTVCRSLGTDSLRTLGDIIAQETGFAFDDQAPV